MCDLALGGIAEERQLRRKQLNEIRNESTSTARPVDMPRRPLSDEAETRFAIPAIEFDDKFLRSGRTHEAARRRIVHESQITTLQKNIAAVLADPRAAGDL